MPLTAEERRSFTAEKLAQIDRWTRIDASLVPPQDENENAAAYAARLPALRAKVVGQLANMGPKQLRARVNVTGVTGNAIQFSADSDFTQAEKDAIAAGYKSNQGRAWSREIPAILDAKAEGLAAGLTDAQVLFVLRNR